MQNSIRLFCTCLALFMFHFVNVRHVTLRRELILPGEGGRVLQEVRRRSKAFITKNTQ